jgi:hypothetical protein
MTTVEEDIAILLEDPVNGHTNRLGVGFCGEIKQSPGTVGYCEIFNISVKAVYPGFSNDDPGISLELHLNFQTLVGFMMQFEIVSIEVLEKISAQILLDFYRRGRAYVFCRYGDGYICFRKKEEVVFISDYGVDERPIPDMLEKPNEFVNFTKWLRSIGGGY